jgi:hypothetical protein
MAESLPWLECAFEKLKWSVVHGLARPFVIITTRYAGRTIDHKVASSTFDPIS